MSKMTKNQRIDKLVACLRTQGRKMRELEARLSTQEKWTDYADNMLTELNHALPDPEYDAKREAQEADIDASLDRHRKRLGLNKPQLKQLDQSVFPLIERDIAKELLEVDLSSELTGSELCRAMLARGDKFILCGVSDVDDADAASNEYDDLVSDAVTDFNCKGGFFGTVSSMRWYHAVPINNQGEPLTQAEAGL